ncbi:MAG: pilus assembly protein TadG-related protein [Actinomycetota bacterium]|nr:pilus assembly protein TadG-related protein [Actinomycetota bacterium]
MRNRLARSREERGSIIVLAAVGMVLAMISAGLAVDLGTLAHEARRNQKVADLAALDASRVPVADYQSAALVSAARNGFPTGPGYSVTAVEGVKTDGQCVAQSGSGTVCVTVTSPHKNDFPFVGGSRTVSRAAVAGAGNAIGTVRVGSSVVSASGTVPAQQVPILNRLVSSLIGGTYSTNAVGWQGLANGHVTFGALTSALASVTGDGTFNAGTPDQVLQSTFTAKQLFTATANALNNSGEAANVGVANSVQNIGAAANGTTLSAPLKLYDFFDFGSVVIGNKQDVANARLNVLDLITGAAILADGDNFASFNLAAGDIVGGVIPGGFSGAKVSMSLIEAPQTSFPGPPGKDPAGEYYTQAHTSQVRIKLEAGFNIPLTNAISIPLVGTLTNISVTVPYDVKLGRGHAYLEQVNCGATSQPTNVVIKGATEAATSRLGAVSDADLRATVVNPVPQIGVIGSALAGAVEVRLTNSTSTTVPGNPGVDLTFLPPYEDGSPSQPVPGTGVNLPSLGTSNTTATVLGVLNTGLLNDVINGVNASGLSFSTNTVGLNGSILQPVLDALGLSFASADVWAPPVQNCAALSPVPTQSNSTPVLKG